MRTKYTLWKIIEKYYPYYDEVSISENIKYLSRSTVITNEEEELLYEDLNRYDDVTTLQKGNNLLDILVYENSPFV